MYCFSECFITTLKAYICNWKQLLFGLLAFYFLNQSKQFALPESQAFEKSIVFHEQWEQELSTDSSFSKTFA